MISSLIVIVCPNREKPREDWTQSIELVSWFVFLRLIGVEQRVLHLEPGSATEQKGSSAGGGHWGTGRRSRRSRSSRSSRRRALGHHWEDSRKPG